MGEARAIEPFGFFTLESLRAGWYLAWRLVVFTTPFTLVPVVAAAVVGAWGWWLAAALIGLGGIVLGVVAAVRITSRVAGAWALGEYGRRLTGGVWWSVTWRVVLVSLPLSLLLAPLSLFLHGPLFVGGVLDLLLPAVGLLLAGFFVAATLQSCGWAMSTAVADRLGPAAGLDEPDPLDEPAPVRGRVLVPRPASPPRAIQTARPVPEPRAHRRERRAAGRARAATIPATPAAALRCPKCGLLETERGSVIGWYCRVCGWREKRA